MSFASDIYTLLTANTAVNNSVSGIYYQIIPDNESITANNIVYDFYLSESIDILAQNNLIDIYNVDIIILSDDTLEVNTIAGLLRNYLDNYKDSKFGDVKAENFDVKWEGERGQYIGTLKYKITYLK